MILRYFPAISVFFLIFPAISFAQALPPPFCSTYGSQIRLAEEFALVSIQTTMPATPAIVQIPAEARVAALREAENVEALADYALALIAAYRQQKEFVGVQEALITELKAERAKFVEGLEQIRLALAEERQAREKMADRLAALSDPRWKSVLNGAALGTSIGGQTSGSVKGAAIGLAIGGFVEWVRSAKK